MITIIISLVGSLGQSFLSIFVDSAQWLLFGFFIAGLIKAFVPQELLQRHLGGNNIASVIKGAIFGAPLPLCSCGVIPAALGLHRAGASKPATTSFLIATPETGVDSISVTYALLGPFMAIIRPIAAISTAITAGLLVLFLDKEEVARNFKKAQLKQEQFHPKQEQSSCCSSEKKDDKPVEAVTSSCCASNNTKQAVEKTDACCASKTEQKSASSACSSATQVSEVTESSCCNESEPVASDSVMDKIKAGLTFSFVDLLKDISVWLLIGLVVAAVIMAFVPPSFLQTWGATPYAYLIMALIGVPMYICATSSTPIAAGLLFAGVSPGAVLVFMLVGPATNIATLTLVKQELGKKTLTIYLTSIAMLGFLFGGLTDWLANRLDIQAINQVSEHVHTTPLAIVSSVVLALLLVNALWVKYR